MKLTFQNQGDVNMTIIRRRKSRTKLPKKPMSDDQNVMTGHHDVTFFAGPSEALTYFQLHEDVRTIYIPETSLDMVTFLDFFLHFLRQNDVIKYDQ